MDETKGPGGKTEADRRRARIIRAAAAPGAGSTVRRLGRAARDTGARLAEQIRPAASKLGRKLARDIAPAAKRVGRTIGEGAGIAAGAARTSAQVLAIRAQVAAARTNITSLYAKIGEAHYKSLRDPSQRPAAQRGIKALAANVDALRDRVAGLEAREKAVRAERALKARRGEEPAR